MLRPPTALPENYRTDIERAVQILKAGGCHEVFLFGSLASGEFRDGSDIDLAVTGCPANKFFQLGGKLLMELEHSVDLIDLDNNDRFTEYLKKQGELVRVD